ncbi:hypothetical protein DM860_011832 [Cuscuta australis]|uniref:Uncharacterized protein n=1 Tax=Cuscuta australis TaxID=267555 RepID=A0A328DFG9_9ASTE|nr:hypothetical protein DM860_011832 [Cuscuta australis]
MADCHQRLEPGRHPDGFVPSHDVVQVHDLLGECICALGHPCIFDHPQEQPVYNPGHIRRWTGSWRNAPAVGVRHGGGVSGGCRSTDKMFIPPSNLPVCPRTRMTLKRTMLRAIPRNLLASANHPLHILHDSRFLLLHSALLQVETPAFHDWLCLASSGPIPEFQASEFQSCRFGRPLASPIQMDDQAPAAEESSVAVV